VTPFTTAAFPLGELAAAILDAADRANIGLAVTLLEPPGARNVYLRDAAVRLLGAPREELLHRPAVSVLISEDQLRLEASSIRSSRLPIS